MHHKEGQFKGARGANIYYQSWSPERAPRALIVLVHGAAEHGGRYRRFAEHFSHVGYAIAALDHIGHGRSDGTPGYVDRFTDYVDTLDEFCTLLDEEFPGVPKVLLGHSMGGLISSCYLLQEQQRFHACVLSGPAIKTELEPPFWQRWLIQALSLFAPKMGALQLDANAVSRDPHEVEQYMADPLVYNGKLSARKLAELFKAMLLVQTRAAEIKIPLLLMHGAADSLAAPEGSRFLHDNVSSTDKTLTIYPGLYHEIFNEPERQQVFADLESWLERRLDRRGTA